MDRLIDIYDVEKICEYKGNVYSVRDNGAVMRHPQGGKKTRTLDNDKYNIEDVKEELADVLNYCLQMCYVLHLDPIQIMNEKMDKAEKKYPVEKAKGKSTKYNKL